MVIAKEHIYSNPKGALKKQKELSKKMSPNFGGARQEAQDWVSGMGGAVTDKPVAQRIGKASKKDVKGFIGKMEKSLLW